MSDMTEKGYSNLLGCITTIEKRVTKLEGRFNKGYVKNQEERIAQLERTVDRLYEIIKYVGREEK